MSEVEHTTGARKDRALKWTLATMLVVVLTLPFVFRPAHGSREPVEAGNERRANLPEKTLTLISPHWEGVRTEFGRAFSEWTASRYGHPTRLEWLDVGGCVRPSPARLASERRNERRA